MKRLNGSTGVIIKGCSNLWQYTTRRSRGVILYTTGQYRIVSLKKIIGFWRRYGALCVLRESKMNMNVVIQQ